VASQDPQLQHPHDGDHPRLGPAANRRFRSIDTPPGWKSPIRFLDTLTGNEFGHIDSLGFEGPGPDISPAEPVMSSQELIEEIMLDAARASGLVEFRFSTEVTAILRGGDADDTDVEIEIRHRETGSTERLTAPALVGADGAASFVRSALDIGLEGHKELSHLVNCYFKADVEPLIEERHGVLLFVSTDAAKGVLQPLDARGRWLCQINVDEEEWTPEVFTDAAHQFPPTGGLGVNTGLQGMHNAMWKLAWYVQDLADWSLVETYETERKPVSRRIVDQSLVNSFNVHRIRDAMRDNSLDTMEADEVLTESRRYGNHLGVDFGAVDNSPAVIADGTTAPEVNDDYSDYSPSATPGARAPHHWLGSTNAKLSTVDLPTAWALEVRLSCDLTATSHGEQPKPSTRLAPRNSLQASLPA
jgi:hypothetical protein